MTRSLIVLILFGLFAMPAITGCVVKKEDDDDDVELKVDNEGTERGVKIDRD